MDSKTFSKSGQGSAFDSASYIPPDSIFEVTKNYLADSHPQKVNVGAGTYRDENGQPWVLPSVRMARSLIADCGHEYLPIAGLKSFREGVNQLVFHDTSALRKQCVGQISSFYERPLTFVMIRLPHVNRFQAREHSILQLLH